jgi:DNA-binding beta-propeller fold protein YncE
VGTQIRHGLKSCGLWTVLLTAVAAIASLTIAAAAQAAPPEFLSRFSTSTVRGSGAGQFDVPRAIAANPTTGRVYVSDQSNARIVEYTAWGLFVGAWGWGVETGAPALEQCGPAEPTEAPAPNLCRKGLAGAGAGQLSRPTGITVDSSGDVYVFELDNRRVQKFSATGEFELMFGGKVNLTKVAASAPAQQQNVCPVDPGDVCQKGTAGDAPSHFAGVEGDYIDYSTMGPEPDAIVVGDKDRIQIFNLDGTYREEIGFEGPWALFAGESVNALDTDAAGNIYFSLAGVEDVYKVSPNGVPLAPGLPGESHFDVVTPLDAAASLGVAVDHLGNVYAVEDPPAIIDGAEARVLKFDPAGNLLVPTQEEAEEGRFFPYLPFQGPLVTAIATNFCAGSPQPGNLYIAFHSLFKPESYVDAYGSGPVGCEAPPKRPPLVASQYAIAVGAETASVRAEINPRFWDDATFYVEYGTGRCSEGGCPTKVPVPPLPLTDQVVNKPLKTGAVSLSGLVSGTTYNFRFVAESSGGGPVFGEDPDAQGPQEATFEAGIERRFRTANAPRKSGACPNDGFRLGAGAELPDCRAYEMVSPLDKEGGDVALWIGKNALFPFFFEFHQSALSGDRFAFTSAYAFANPASTPYVSQYLSQRTTGGWASEAISPPRSESPVSTEALFESEFHGFSEDLCRAWLVNYSVAPLTPDAVARYPNLYRRENCTTPAAYEALTTQEPQNRKPSDYLDLRAHGASADGTHTIFAANAKLHPDAPNLKGNFREVLLYEDTPTGLRFVCYLPAGNPSGQPCAAGTPASGTLAASARNAISADGERIFWSAFTGVAPGGDDAGTPGQIYVRIGGAKTLKVSGEIAPDPAWYWTAANDGSKAIFAFDSGSHAGELYEYDVDRRKAELIAEGVEGPMGASEDASRLYFSATEDLDGGGAGTTGAHNLYLYEADPAGGLGSFKFVMPLAAADIGGSTAAPAPVDEVPVQRTARVSPDGLHVTFSATAPPPSGYDNREGTNGERAQEVYRYDATSDDLRCISCNPTGARPTAESIGAGESYWAAARIQGWEVLQHAPRVISDDGSRVFFESLEPLVPRDTNGGWDVYQWEEPGTGSCTKADSTFGDEAGGCVDLISSGESSAKSTFLDADPSGNNAFFSTQSSLVSWDYGLNDVYVARVGGGFAGPQATPECEGDACQGPAAPPVAKTPASSTYSQPPAKTRRKARRCKRGARKVRRRGKVRCVRKAKRGAKKKNGKRGSRNTRKAAK